MATREEVVRLYEKFDSKPIVAEKLGITCSTVSYHLKRAGIKPKPRSLELQNKIVEAFRRLGTKQAVADELGISHSTVFYNLKAAGADSKPVVAGRVGVLVTEQRSLPKNKAIKRYILTSAQNNTKIYQPVWENLLAMAAHYKAEILVSRFVYNKNAYSHKSVKLGRSPNSDGFGDLWYAPELKSYLCDAQIELTPTLVFCGEMNILPTAKRPLSGFETYTGTKSGIFPHAKMAMQSVPTAKNEPTKFNYTTGTVTQRNYIQCKAGLSAEFHHCYGAVLVEVNSAGQWWVRQLNYSEKEGSLYDLDVCATRGKITKGNRVEGITWGDLHEVHLDHKVMTDNWKSPNSMMSVLGPRYQFMHDVIHFNSRNHHERGNPHSNFRRFIDSQENVEDEIKRSGEFLKATNASDCAMIVVRSNHDDFLSRWLRECDYKTDPVNALFFLKAQSRFYQSIKDNEKGFQIVPWALRSNGCPEDVTFLAEDESFVICGSIECGMHGHLGPNGARGTAGNLARMGRKANVGHTHSAGILDGMYTSGVTAALDQGYNRGPSSWSHSHIVTYSNGKRAIITISDGRWKA